MVIWDTLQSWASFVPHGPPPPSSETWGSPSAAQGSHPLVGGLSWLWKAARVSATGTCFIYLAGLHFLICSSRRKRILQLTWVCPSCGESEWRKNRYSLRFELPLVLSARLCIVRDHRLIAQRPQGHGSQSPLFFQRDCGLCWSDYGTWALISIHPLFSPQRLSWHSNS